MMDLWCLWWITSFGFTSARYLFGSFFLYANIFYNECVHFVCKNKFSCMYIYNIYITLTVKFECGYYI